MPFRTWYIGVPASHVIKLNWLITLRGGRAPDLREETLSNCLNISS